MTDATFWIFFGVMPVMAVLLGLAAYAFNTWSVQADERKSRMANERVGGSHPPA